MPRDFHINLYHERDVTRLDTLAVIDWCEANLSGGWNVVSDSGPRALRGDGAHVVLLLCVREADAALFSMVWG